jgi:thymidylate synthase (FAD)
VRHRLASYAQESSRYCNYSTNKFGNVCSFIEPPGLTEYTFAAWKYACQTTEQMYFDLLEQGCSPQIARAVLPTCLKTELVMTANFREFRHFIQLRSSKAAHPQIRPIANEIWAVLYGIAPEVFIDIEP